MTTMTTMQKSKHTLALAATLALLAGCGGGGGDGPTPPEETTEATFSASLQGGVNGSYSGKALFASAGIAGFGIVLASEKVGQEMQISFTRALAAPPATGEYRLVDLTDPDPEPEPTEADFQGRVGLAMTSASGVLVGTGGLLTITKVETSRIVGRFEFTAENVPLPGEVAHQTTVSGTFVALNAVK